jgi:hypothetical protein
MHGFPRRLVDAAILAIGLLATAARPASAVVPLRLLSPGDGAVLRSGSLATLEWVPSAAFSGPERWEEWEAFLSLDGGATYPVRLTPHLDRELRRIRFKVPALPTADARLLLRIGDERREIAFELPERFTIAAAPGLLPDALDLPRTVWRRGEPARPGEAGVLVWVEGSRRGGALREVVAEEPAQVTSSGVEPAQGRPAPAVVPSEEPPSGVPATDLDSLTELHPPRTGTTANPRASRPAITDILLLMKRQNE